MLVGERLRRPWLASKRVIVDGEVVRGAGVAEVALARTAVHVYAHRAAGFSGLGSIPRFPPPDLAQAVVRIDSSGRDDEKSAAFRVAGESLDPVHLTQLTGLQPDVSWKRGQFRMNRGTGLTYRVQKRGCWGISSDGKVDTIGQSVEVHLRFLLDRLDDPAGALAQFDGYLAQTTHTALAEEALFGRATALSQLGRAEAERETWRTLLARYPSSVYADRARVRMGRNQ